MRTGLDDGPRLDGSDTSPPMKPEGNPMAAKVRIIMEDGVERVGYIDMRSFRSINLAYHDPVNNLDTSKPLTLRKGGKECRFRLWFVEGRFIYGAYRYYDDQKWIQHAWFLDGSAMAKKRPHGSDLVYSNLEVKP